MVIVDVVCSGSTNIVIHRRLARIKGRVWLECDIFMRLFIFFIFGMPTHFLVKSFSSLELLLGGKSAIVVVALFEVIYAHPRKFISI